MRRSALILARMLVWSVLLASTANAGAQADYPSRPVRLVSGYAPGGTASFVGRLIGQKLSDRWSQQFILDNRPGGGTLIGAEIVAKAPPDGYTLMLIDSVHVRAPLLLTAPYDPIKDFASVARQLTQPQFRETLFNLGFDPKVNSPQKYADALKASQAWNMETIALLRGKGVNFDF